MVFLDAQMDGDGCWIIQVGTLSAFVRTAQVPNCPQLSVAVLSKDLAYGVQSFHQVSHSVQKMPRTIANTY